MAEWTGHFDPKVFQAFVKSMGIYPVGSLVRLRSGRIGVVTEQSLKSLTMPMILETAVDSFQLLASPYEHSLF